MLIYELANRENRIRVIIERATEINFKGEGQRSRDYANRWVSNGILSWGFVAQPSHTSALGTLEHVRDIGIWKLDSGVPMHKIVRRVYGFNQSHICFICWILYSETIHLAFKWHFGGTFMVVLRQLLIIRRNKVYIEFIGL